MNCAAFDRTSAISLGWFTEQNPGPMRRRWALREWSFHKPTPLIPAPRTTTPWPARSTETAIFSLCMLSSSAVLADLASGHVDDLALLTRVTHAHMHAHGLSSASICGYWLGTRSGNECSLESARWTAGAPQRLFLLVGRRTGRSLWGWPSARTSPAS